MMTRSSNKMANWELASAHSLSFPHLAAGGRSFDEPGKQAGPYGVANRVQTPIYKLSSTGAADPRRRLKWLNTDRYAARVRERSEYREEPGFDGWTFQLFLAEKCNRRAQKSVAKHPRTEPSL